jgi:hypothetical protein
MRVKPNKTFVLVSLIGICLCVNLSFRAGAQPPRHIKVVLRSQQTESLNREGVQGAGSVVIRRGTVSPSGRVIANERQTTVQRNTGIFTLVLDGGESILTVATRVPQSQVSYFYNYALGGGCVERRIVFNDVGTSLKVHATTLADGHIRLRLTPRISYFSVDRPGAIDFTEASTEMIVPNGQLVSLGGATSSMHEVTRQILGYQNRSSRDESHLQVSATIQ